MTTTKPTSAATYHALIKEGRLGGRRGKCLGALLYLGKPSTAQELAKEAGDLRSGHKRLSELVRMGLVVEAPARECAVTGRRAVTWTPADPLPTDPLVLSGAKEKAKGVARKTVREEELEAEITRLRAAKGDDDDDDDDDDDEQRLAQHFLDGLATALGVKDWKEYGSDGSIFDAVDEETGTILAMAGLLDPESGRMLLEDLKGKAAASEANFRAVSEVRAELSAVRELLKREKEKTKETAGFVFTAAELRAAVAEARSGDRDGLEIDRVVVAAVARKRQAIAPRALIDSMAMAP